MLTYSQNKEDLFILDYFKGFKGSLFDVGANDGITFSNSKLLIDNGWQAHCFEPGSVYEKLYNLHGEDDNVRLNDFGLSDKSETVKFWESENHVPNGNDSCLVSTTVFEETKRWPDVIFHEKEIRLTSFNDYYGWIGKPTIDFISMDIEGGEWALLQSIDLNAIGCKCLCIEWNSIPELQVQFTNYCASYGLKLAHVNNENLIFVR